MPYAFSYANSKNMIGLFKKWLDYMNIVSDIYPLLQPFNSYVEGGGQ